MPVTFSVTGRRTDVRRPLAAYAIAIGTLAAAVLLRWLLDPLLGDTIPFVTLFGAVAIGVWAGGYRPALLVAVLGYLACNYLFIAPRYELGPADLQSLVGLLAYLFTCLVIIWIGQAMRVAQQRAGERGELLRVTLGSIGDAVITTDINGRVRYLNATAETLTGWKNPDAIGQPLDTVFRIASEQDGRPVESPVTRALREGAVVGLESHTVLVAKDGVQRPIDDSAAPIRDDHGRVVGCVLIFRDISERRRWERHEAERLLSARLLASIVESSDDAIVSKSLDGIIQTWNAAAERLFGHSAAEAVGRHISLVIPPDRIAEEEHIIGRLRAGQRVEHFETERVRKNGESVSVSLTISPIRDATGRVVGASKIARDITERRRLEDNLRKLAADLSDVDRRKNEFLATLAHELRNPLAPLRNMLEFLKRADADSQTLRRAVDMMQRQLSQLVRLVDDLLDVSRITHGRLELRKRPIEIAAVIDQAIESCRPLAEAGGHELRTDVPAEPIYVNADEARLTQVFANLVNNSCKYTNPGGKIAVTAQRDGDDVVVSVRDNGIGITRDKLDRIFDMFMQVERSAERSQGGLGIGLTLVKRLAEMHGGAVEARSAGDALGSEFVVRLPVLLDRADASDTGPAAAEDQSLPRRILVVDDNTDAASSLAMLLRLTGHETNVAHDGLAAIQAVERYRPDVVLLDIGLPALNGYEVCREIRRQPWGADMVLIALTGWGQEQDRRDSREAGFDGHLVKPVEYAALMALLGSLATGKTPAGRSARA